MKAGCSTTRSAGDDQYEQARVGKHRNIRKREAFELAIRGWRDTLEATYYQDYDKRLF